MDLSLGFRTFALCTIDYNGLSRVSGRVPDCSTNQLVTPIRHLNLRYPDVHERTSGTYLIFLLYLPDIANTARPEATFDVSDNNRYNYEVNHEKAHVCRVSVKRVGDDRRNY